MSSTQPVYLDNAATTHPKPDVVYAASDEFLRHGGNPGRGSYNLAVDSARVVFEARVETARFLGIKNPERLIFTPGCTYSINMALKGLSLNAGDVVVVGALEHNAVMRPLAQLARTKGIRIQQIPYAKKGIVDLHSFIKVLLETHPKLVVLGAGSNVTGEKIDITAIGAICGAHKIPLMIDAAQTAGRDTTGIDVSGISIWCASGHKGLFGPQGVGLLYVRETLALEPLIVGGTGSQSDSWEMPPQYPDHLESGTQAGPAIAGLGAAVRWLSATGTSVVAAKEQALTDRFLHWAVSNRIVQVYGNRTPGDRQCSVVSFSVEGMDCAEVARMLNEEFSIAVRSGLQCAALAHASLGTTESGVLRMSLSYFNSETDVDRLIEALTTIKSWQDTGQLKAHW